MQTSDTSKELVCSVWNMCKSKQVHEKVSLAVNVARAVKAAIKVPSSHFREPFHWVYNTNRLFVMIELEIKYFDVKEGFGVLCFSSGHSRATSPPKISE